MHPKSKPKRKRKQAPVPSAAPSHDELVVDRQARHECGGVSRMTFNRWKGDPELQLPPAVVIRKRNYRWRSQLEQFKERLRAMGRLS
jgi:hypothetical protein